MSKALAFIDLLGFSNMVSKDYEKAKQILNDFYNLTYEIIKEEGAIKGNLFSDSLLVHSDNPAILVNTITKIYRECLKKNKEYLRNDDLKGFFLLPRGGVSAGVVDIEERAEAPNLTKGFIVSPALVHSAKMESKIKGSRLLIADDNSNNEIIFNWNINITSILYKKETFVFWENFNYYDALWFLDTSKKYDNQKDEVKELLNIIFSLVEANSTASKEILEQHIQTLRIGLLSYTKFLNTCYLSDCIIEKIINDFSDDKYWLIWLTLIEVIMQISDSFILCDNANIINFYKRVSIKESWIKVIKEINDPKNKYLKESFKNFLNESWHIPKLEVTQNI
ncbi:hypothetical protein [Aliarcobacter butzleri]|uniref:hypothetical protein n=1 Tax=Aliarcobacter butzleri TaxID=28197 RepID=UPI001EDAB5D6|nr:hypothetical protein [Aliarcobacter butzleri]MCG3690104.1 hypothetical protein [Aliarcobacter butzleri]